MDFPFFVGYPPDPPDTYIKIKSPPPPIIFLSLSHIFSAASLTPSLHHPHASITALLPHRITASPVHPIFLPPSLSAFSLSFIVTKLQWCSLSLGVCLRKKSPSWGGSRSSEILANPVRSRRFLPLHHHLLQPDFGYLLCFDDLLHLCVDLLRFVC
jgi:hypothetical protein